MFSAISRGTNLQLFLQVGRCLLIIALLKASPLPAQSRTPYQTEVKGLNSLVQLMAGERPTVRLQFRNTIGVREHLILSRRSPYDPRSTEDQVVINQDSESWHFFQGYKKARHSWKGLSGAAATVVEGEKLIIFLIGSRGRGYEITVPLKQLNPGQNSTRARLRFARRTLSKPCSDDFLYANLSNATTPSEQNATGLRLRPNRIRYYVRLFTEADAEFYAEFGEETPLQMRSLLNASEAIYLSQLGIRFDLTDESYYTDINNQPLTSNNPAGLILAFRNLSLQNRDPASYDIGHLFTGKTLEGSTIGVAFPDTVCLNPQNSFSLSKRFSNAVDWITLAHEIGHNFGASHDSQQSSSIMSPMVQPGHSSFSPFSINEITEHIFSTFESPETSCLRREDQVALQRLPGKRRLFFGAEFVLPHQMIGCEFTLYGSGNRRLLRSAPLGNRARVRRLSSFDVQQAGSLKIEEEITDGIRPRRYRAFLRGKFSCQNGVTSYTPIRRLNSNRLPRRLLRTIQQSLNN